YLRRGSGQPRRAYRGIRGVRVRCAARCGGARPAVSILAAAAGRHVQPACPGVGRHPRRRMSLPALRPSFPPSTLWLWGRAARLEKRPLLLGERPRMVKKRFLAGVAELADAPG